MAHSAIGQRNSCQGGTIPFERSHFVGEWQSECLAIRWKRISLDAARGDGEVEDDERCCHRCRVVDWEKKLPGM